MSLDNILVSGCPLCEIFLNPKDNINTKLYYPHIDKINDSNYVIIKCKSCNDPMVVIRDHVDYIHPKIWSDVVYRCKKILGYNIEFNTTQRTILDHVHVHISNKRY